MHFLMLFIGHLCTLIAYITPVSNQLDPVYPCVKKWPTFQTFFRETSTSSDGMNGYDSVILKVTNLVL